MFPCMTGERDYFAAGLAILAEGGLGAVTIARLCEALGVTKGSFYHHFRNVEDYKTRLLSHWAIEREREVVAAAAAVGDPYDRLDVLIELSIGLPHEAEVAIRSWARTDDRAWAMRELVDAARERTVREAFLGIGVDPVVAEEFGRLAVAVLVGAQNRSASTDREGLRLMYRRLTSMALAVYGPGEPDG
jgi:AcrR family transcriptional regulator